MSAAGQDQDQDPPLSVSEKGDPKVLRIDIWSRRRTPPHVLLGQVTVTLPMLRSEHTSLLDPTAALT